MSWMGADGAAKEFRPDADMETTVGAFDPELVGPWRQTTRRFRRNRVAMVALMFVLLVVVAAILAPLVSPQNPDTLTSSINAGPSFAHWLGTDDVGRDTLSRLIWGARISMQVSFQVVLLALLVALPLGLLAGYRGRYTDSIIMRFMDAMFAFPPLTLALAVAALLGAGTFTISVAIAVVFVPGFVRIIRAQVLAVKEETFVEAARSVGSGTGRILRGPVLMNVTSPLIVQVAISFGYALLAEAGLSFLGFGVQSPAASWGTMLQSAYQFVLSSPWPMIPPGVAIVLTVLAFNLVGDGLRDALGRDAIIAQSGR
jgi:peptide/nickel transport system permease protein